MVVAPAEPCTSSIADSRTLPAAVFASAVLAGTIASSSGNAIVTPMPLSTIRRERCFFSKNIVFSSSREELCPEPVYCPAVVSTAAALAFWNAALLITPVMNADILLPFFAALRTIARIAGMS